MAAEVPEVVRFIWEQAEKRLEAQIRQADGLDTKAGVLVGIHAVAVAALVSSFPRFGDVSAVLVTLVLAGLAVSGLLALLAFRAQDYDRSPRPEELWRFVQWREQDVQRRFLSTRFRAIEENRSKLRRRRGSFCPVW